MDVTPYEELPEDEQLLVRALAGAAVKILELTPLKSLMYTAWLLDNLISGFAERTRMAHQVGLLEQLDPTIQAAGMGLVAAYKEISLAAMAAQDSELMAKLVNMTDRALDAAYGLPEDVTPEQVTQFLTNLFEKELEGDESN